MNSENSTVEYSLIELYLLLPGSPHLFCPDVVVVHINPL